MPSRVGLSGKTRVSFGFICFYLFMAVTTWNIFSTPMVNREGVITDIQDRVLVVRADTGEMYNIDTETSYTATKRVGDSIEFTTRGDTVYDRMRAEGEQTNRQTLKSLWLMAEGIMMMLTMVIIYAWPYGEYNTRAIYHNMDTE